MTSRVPACPSFEEVARLPSDIEAARQDPFQLFWFETAGRSRLAIHTLVHVNVWDIGVSRPQLAYRVPTISNWQSAVTGDGAFLVVARGRGRQPGSDTHIVDAATGADLRMVPPRDPARPAGGEMIFPLPGTSLLAGVFGTALAVVDAATGRFVAMRDLEQEPLPPGRIAARPTEPLARVP